MTAGPQAYPSFHFDLQRLLWDRTREHRHTQCLSPRVVDHWRLSVWLCDCGGFFGCLMDYGPFPQDSPHSSVPVNAATDFEQRESCGIMNVMLRGVSGNGLGTARDHSNGAVEGALRLRNKYIHKIEYHTVKYIGGSRVNKPNKNFEIWVCWLSAATDGNNATLWAGAVSV